MRLEYFQLIDRIADLNVEDRSIKVDAAVPEKSTIFEGHFPGHPLMPGVLLCEAMAQTSGWLIIGVTKFERMPFLAAVKELKLRSFVQPGHNLRFTAKIAHLGSGFAMTEAKGEVDGKPACDATIMFRVVEFPNQDMRGHMVSLAEKLNFPMGVIAHG